MILNTRIRSIEGRLLLLISLFVFFFNIKVKGCPITSGLILAGLGVLVLLFHIYAGRKLYFGKSFQRFLLTYMILLIISISSAVLHFTFDFSFVKTLVFYIPLGFLGGYFIAHIVSKYKLKLEDILKAITICFFIQSIITVVFFLNRNLMCSILEYCDMGDRVNGIVSTYVYRAFGFFFGFDYGTAELTVACLCGTYLCLTEKEKYRRWICIVVFCSLVGILVARTMFVGILFIMLFFFFFPCEYRHRKRRIIITLVCVSAAILTCLLLTVDLSKYQWTKLWITDMFSQFNGGGLKHGSLYEILNNMIWYPGHKTFFLGDGMFYPDGVQYMNTDVGYMRLILYFGIFGTIATVLFVIYGGRSFFCEKKSKQLGHLSLMIICLQLVFMYKIMYFLIDYFALFIVLNVYPFINRKRNDLCFPLL